MFDDHYNDWIQSRMTTINKYLNVNYFMNKELLELGGGYGYNSNDLVL